MKRLSSVILSAGIAAILSACSTAPEKPIEELQTARAIVPQVEASPRAGVAAENISAARKSLDAANKLADSGGTLDDIRFEANVAAKNAQIANEKVLTANAKDELAKGEEERQKVVLASRERETLTAQAHARSLEDELKDLKAKKTDRGIVLTLGDVLFDTGKSSLKSGAYSTIDRLAKILKESPGRKVEIEGHTDSVGSDELNQGLSEERARAVQAALMQRGADSGQITSVGKGEGFPVAGNDNAAGRQQNRRVEMIFTEDTPRVASDSG